MGQGMMTGRGSGVCNTIPDVSSAAYTWGIGSGRKIRNGGRFCRQGVGMGLGRRFSGNPVLESEKISQDVALKLDMLKTQADSVKQTLDKIYDQINVLEKTRAT